MTTPTTNTSETSVLKALRALMPLRPLTLDEGLRIAELQANRLLELSGIDEPGVPTEIVTELPRFRVALDFDLPTSGLAHWDGTAWVLTVKADEPYGRRRFSTFHEFKHVLDHPTRQLIAAERNLTAELKAERLADYFAGCVLMPKRWVTAAWCGGAQSIEVLAARFEVTPRAMAVRLGQLGLTAPARRCDNPPSSYRSPTRPWRPRYYRQLSKTPIGGLA